MNAQAPDGTRKVDLVFQGGGVKGIALVGAYAVLEEHGYRVQNVAGSSAGAIVAALIAAGYTAPELRGIIGGQSFIRMLDKGWEDYFTIGGLPLLSMILEQGIYEGEVFLNEMRILLAAKGVHTFRDLINPESADDPRFRYKVMVTASDVTEHRLLILPRDADHLGVDPDDFEVARAVQMSMTVPILFEPVRFKNPRTGNTHLIVDGGILCNYPIWLFDDPTRTWPTYGLHLKGATATQVFMESILDSPSILARLVNALTSVLSVRYTLDMMLTLIEAHDRWYLEQSDFSRTIGIDTAPVSILDFDLSAEKREALYEAGRSAALDFLTARHGASPTPVA